MIEFRNSRLITNTYFSILVKPIGGDIVNWEDDFDVVPFSLLNKACDLFRSWGVKKRITDLSRNTC